MEMSLPLVLLVGLFALVSEYIDSSLGMGYGTTLVPLLLLLGFEPLQVVPAVLLSEFAAGLVAALLHHSVGNVRFERGSEASRTALLLGVCGLVGAVVAVALAVNLPPRFVGAYIGAMVTATGVVILVTRRVHLPFSWVRLAGVGVVGSFNKAIGGGGYGTIVTGGQLLSGVDPKQAVAVTSLSEGAVSLIGLVTYFVLAGPVNGMLTIALLVGALASTPLSAFTVRKLRFDLLRVLVGFAAIALGLATLAQFALA